MKRKLLSTLLVSSFLLIGCGSDDDSSVVDPVEPPVVEPPVVVPPVTETITIDDTEAVILTVDEYNAETGDLTFTLDNGDSLAITDASDYSIMYFGYPDPASSSSNAKAWKRWHVSQTFNCDTSTEDACAGILTETETQGQYSFNAVDLDLESKAAAGAVEVFKVAIQIHGAKATNEFELIPAGE
ncbi:hypothetical protein L2735_03280 [Shewanella olleyana]|uniref:hypothetical protein n=1 Tax=Shewanella olleyana TaxID=135626 RepID=UPI00200E491A|nr:hypothetical protein [Shewanella olleyana]MCL1065828.1 hypothetical protein [Shewanella olleyana]